MPTAANLYTASQTAWAKYHRNVAKLAWLDATRQMGDRVVAYAQQLDGYKADAEKATAAFTAACAGMTTEEIVSVIGGAA